MMDTIEEDAIPLLLELYHSILIKNSKLYRGNCPVNDATSLLSEQDWLHLDHHLRRNSFSHYTLSTLQQFLTEKLCEFREIFKTCVWYEKHFESFDPTKTFGNLTALDQKKVNEIFNKPEALGVLMILPWNHMEIMRKIWALENPREFAHVKKEGGITRDPIMSLSPVVGQFAMHAQTLIEKLSHERSAMDSRPAKTYARSVNGHNLNLILDKTQDESQESSLRRIEAGNLKSRKRKSAGSILNPDSVSTSTTNRFVWNRENESHFLTLYHGFLLHGKLTEGRKLCRSSWKALRNAFNRQSSSGMELSQLKDKLKRLKLIYMEVKWLQSQDGFQSDGKNWSDAQWESIRVMRPEAYKLRTKLPWEPMDTMAVIMGDRECTEYMRHSAMRVKQMLSEDNSGLEISGIEREEAELSPVDISSQGDVKALLREQNALLRKLAEDSARITFLTERLVSELCEKDRPRERYPHK